MTPEQVASLLAENERLQKLKDKVGQLESSLETKDALIRWFQAQLFGPKSEKRLLEELTPEDQLWLGEQMLEHSENPPPPDETVASYERKQRGAKRVELSEECSSSRLKFASRRCYSHMTPFP